MTSAQLWAFLAAVMLLGWAITLYILTRAFLPMANSVRVLERVDDFIDKRVIAVVEKARHRAQRATPQQQQKIQDVVSPMEQVERMFGGTGLIADQEDQPLFEQPDPSLEVRE